MNLIDLIIIGLLLLYVLNGFYRGFLPSVLNLGGFVLAWILSFLTYPLLSRGLMKNSFFQQIRVYIEGAEKVGNIEMSRRAVTSLSETELAGVMENAKLPSPYEKAITKNINNQVFANDGLTTVGEYFEMTIYTVVVNIIAFLIIFIILRLVFTLVTNAYSYSKTLPQLQRADGALGGAVALFRGFFSMHIAFTIVPIILIVMPDPFVALFNSSFMTTLFYSGSAVLPFIGTHL